MSKNIQNNSDVATAEESDFWASFKSVVVGQTVPTESSGYEKGAAFNISHGMTVITSKVAGALVQVFKRTEPDDASYLTEAGFQYDRALDMPAIEVRRFAR